MLGFLPGLQVMCKPSRCCSHCAMHALIIVWNASAQGAVKVSDQAALQMVWSKDEAWQPYLLTHMDAIRAKYYPSTVVESAALQLDAPERPDSCKC